MVNLTNSSTVPQVQPPSTTKLGDSPSIAAASVNNGIIPKSPPKHLEIAAGMIINYIFYEKYEVLNFEKVR